jgi:hypothetical protein
VGVSLGFSARLWRAEDTLNAAVQQAELALTEAKRTGRGRTVEATLTLQMLHTRRSCLMEALRTATRDDSLSLVFQPIVSARSGRPQAYEALLRWRCAGMGPISPVEFIPLAEDSGQICAIGHWVLTQACQQASRWPADPRAAPPKVAVNTSLGSCCRRTSRPRCGMRCAGRPAAAAPGHRGDRERVQRGRHRPRAGHPAGAAAERHRGACGRLRHRLSSLSRLREFRSPR